MDRPAAPAIAMRGRRIGLRQRHDPRGIAKRQLIQEGRFHDAEERGIQPDVEGERVRTAVTVAVGPPAACGPRKRRSWTTISSQRIPQSVGCRSFTRTPLVVARRQDGVIRVCRCCHRFPSSSIRKIASKDEAIRLRCCSVPAIPVLSDTGRICRQHVQTIPYSRDLRRGRRGRVICHISGSYS
jgi:hypothetical protein